MKPEMLIVEDQPTHVGYIKSLVANIRKVDRQKYGMDDFDPVAVESAKEATSLLEAAAKANHPYDILLLDLAIPANKGGAPMEGKGFDVLKTARALQAAHEVVIYTSFEGQKNVLRALREGAADFIEKSANVDERQSRLLGAWRRAQEKKSDRLFEQRIRELIPYAERAVAQRFTPSFSTFVQNVVYAAERIESYATERYGLDRQRDSQDSLMQALNAHREAVKKGQEDWSSLQAKLSGGRAKLGAVTVEPLLDEIGESLQPCLMVKETDLVLPETVETRVQSFENDVSAVLREIITGALGDLPNHGNEHCIEVAVGIDPERRRAEVQFSDNLEPISPDDAKTINDGLNVILDTSFGRLWGLQVAQQIAMRGGGRLEVHSEPGRKGNLVTSFIPLA